MIGTIISWTIFGFIVGLIAKFLTPGKDPQGCMVTIGIGIAGSFIGGLLSSVLTGGFVSLHPAGFIMSIVGAVILLVLYRKFGKGS